MLQYLSMALLFLLDLSIGFVIPIYCTIRSTQNSERWLLHWLAFISIGFTVFPFLHWVFSCTLYWVLKIIIEAALLFVIGNYVIGY